MLLNRGDRHDAAVRILQMLAGFLGRHRARFQHQDTGDDLQTVDNAVLHLRQQHFLLFQKVFGAQEIK
jgi:hypothetical protein